MNIFKTISSFLRRQPIDSFQYNFPTMPRMYTRFDEFAEIFEKRRPLRHIAHPNGLDHINVYDGLFFRTAYRSNIYWGEIPRIPVREPTKLTYALGLGLTLFAGSKVYGHFSESKPAVDLEPTKEGQSPSL